MCRDCRQGRPHFHSRSESMLVRFLRRTAQVALSALTVTGLAAAPVLAGGPCKTPCAAPSAAPSATIPGMPPVEPPPVRPVPDVPEAAPSVDVAGGVSGSEFAAPNILGNLLGAGRSVSFF